MRKVGVLLGIFLLIFFLSFNFTSAFGVNEFYCGDGIISNAPDVSFSEQCDPGVTNTLNPNELFNDYNCNAPGTANECQCYGGYTNIYHGSQFPNCCSDGVERDNSGKCCKSGEILSGGSCVSSLITGPCGDGQLNLMTEGCDMANNVYPWNVTHFPGDFPFALYSGTLNNCDIKTCTCPPGFNATREVQWDGQTVYLCDKLTKCSSLSAVSTLIFTGNGDTNSREVQCNLKMQADYNVLLNIKAMRILDLANNTVYSLNLNMNSINLNSGGSVNLSFGNFHVYPNSPIYTCEFELSTNNTCDITQNSPRFEDYDKDGVNSIAQGGTDCDDWVWDDGDVNIINDFSGGNCFANWNNFINAPEKDKFCYNDSNNDGVGDFAACSYCRNPNMPEVADDIDNDCGGSCQGNKYQNCNVSNYLGDGAIDATNYFTSTNGTVYGCGGVVNSFGVADNFCQMVDNNVPIDNGQVCGGYMRAVKGGQMDLSDKQSVKTTNNNVCAGTDLDMCEGLTKRFLFFKPGGMTWQNTEEFNTVDIRNQGAMIGFYNLFYRDFDKKLFILFSGSSDLSHSWSWTYLATLYSGFNPSYDSFPNFLKLFLGPSNEEGTGQITRGTVGLPGQYIDSFKGEFNKKINGVSLFDSFWNSEKSLIQSKDSNNNFKFKWQTSCVAKDKCADAADNNGPVDFFSVQPFASMKNQIRSVVGKDINLVSSTHMGVGINLIDVDEPSCKFDNGGEALMASNYKNLIDFSQSGSLFLPPPLTVNQRILPINSYKQDPFRLKPYCIDLDGDGFCDSPRNLTTGKILGGYGSPSSLGALPSLQFPDCYDSPLDLKSLAVNPQNYYSNIRADQSTGWGNLNENFSAWNFHPFATITRALCDYALPEDNPYIQTGNWGPDVNCNINGVAGYDFSSLYLGRTIFDSDLTTGMEFPQYPQYVRDIACTISPPEQGSMNLISAAIFGVLLAPLAGPALGFVGGTFPTALNALNVYVGFTALLGSRQTISSMRGSWINWKSGNLDGASMVLNEANDVMNLAMILGGATSTFGALAKESKIIIALNNGKNRALAVVIDDVAASSVPRQVIAKETATKIAEENIISTPGGCFLENTSVVMADNTWKNIQDIKLGDLVLAWDLENNKPVATSITSVFMRNETRYLNIEYEEIK